VAGYYCGNDSLWYSSSIVYGYLQSNPGNPGVVLIYGYIYASLFQLYTRSFAPMMFFLIIFLIPAGLALWFIRDRTAPEAALH
jgi:hypothetical protein